MSSAFKLSGYILDETFVSICSVCKRHGKIIVNGRFVTKPFFSKEIGIEVVYSLSGRQHISSDKELELLKAINTSDLPEKASDHEVEMSVDTFVLDVQVIFPIESDTELNSDFDPHVAA